MMWRSHPARCDCLACFGLHLTRDFLLAAVAILLLLSLVAQPSEPPGLIDGYATEGGGW